jgi:hypothetical protein
MAKILLASQGLWGWLVGWLVGQSVIFVKGLYYTTMETMRFENHIQWRSLRSPPKAPWWTSAGVSTHVTLLTTVLSSLHGSVTRVVRTRKPVSAIRSHHHCTQDYEWLRAIGEGKAVPALWLSTTPWRRIGGVEIWLHAFFDLGTRWRWVVSFTPRPLYPQGKSPCYLLDRRMDGLQSRSVHGGEEKNSQPPPGIEP